MPGRFGARVGMEAGVEVWEMANIKVDMLLPLIKAFWAFLVSLSSSTEAELQRLYSLAN